MDSATISALAALSGAVIGGVTSFGTSWLSQQTQAKVQARAHKLSQREDLYKHFIEIASKAYADSLGRQVANVAEITQLVDLYALVSMMRVISSTPIVESANHVVRLIADSYVSPNKTLRELHQMVDSDSIDALRAFSEACRAELQRFKGVKWVLYAWIPASKRSFSGSGPVRLVWPVIRRQLCCWPEWVAICLSQMR